MLKLNHKNLNVWRRSLELVTEIYAKTDLFPADEKFGMTSQLRRASVSIASNISEGAARKSERERKRFYELQDPLWLKQIRKSKSLFLSDT
ncbi:MAG: four helix bundle protein [Balneolaceae bacterium]